MIFYIMLPLLFKNALKVASGTLGCRQYSLITVAKSLSDKKKKIYESQSIDKKN